MTTGKSTRAYLGWVGICLLLAAPAGAAVGVGMTGAVRSQGEELDKQVAAAEAISKDETVSFFSAPTGPLQPVTDVPAAYSTSGASSSLGHQLEYGFRWGDGTVSGWDASLSALNAWPKSGNRLVQVQARCALHKNAYGVSPILRVVVQAGIRTLAGTGSYGYSGDGGLAVYAEIGMITGLVLDADGNIYISDLTANRVRRIDAETGIITRFAGTGTAGYSGDGESALSAKLNMPMGLALDSGGNLYVADWMNHAIRKVDAVTGDISTVAGTGAPGFGGDGGPAIAAQLNGPASVHIGPAGHMYICELMNSRIRKVDYYTGIIDTIAGTDGQGYNGDGIPAATAMLNRPYDVKVDSAGNVYIADTDNHRVRHIDAYTGLIRTYAGTGVAGSSGEGVDAALAQLNRPWGLALSKERHVYITDMNVNRIRRVDAMSGIISTVAGTGSPGFNGDDIAATAANLSMPKAGGVGETGEFIFADFGNYRVRRVAP